MAGAKLISITLNLSLEPYAPPLSGSLCQPQRTLVSMKHPEHSGCPRHPAFTCSLCSESRLRPPPTCGASDSTLFYRPRDVSSEMPPTPTLPRPVCCWWKQTLGSNKIL